MPQVTIRATVIEKITDGVGVPVHVEVKGAGALSDGTIREIAQEALDSFFGSYTHNYRAAFNTFDLRRAKALDPDADRILVHVEEYRP